MCELFERGPRSRRRSFGYSEHAFAALSTVLQITVRNRYAV
jgi:hypothetical protein